MTTYPTRRRFLAALAAAAAQFCPPGWPKAALAENRAPITRTIPASGEALPVIGVGS